MCLKKENVIYYNFRIAKINCEVENKAKKNLRLQLEGLFPHNRRFFSLCEKKGALAILAKPFRFIFIPV